MLLQAGYLNSTLDYGYQTAKENCVTARNVSSIICRMTFLATVRDAGLQEGGPDAGSAAVGMD